MVVVETGVTETPLEDVWATTAFVKLAQRLIEDGDPGQAAVVPFRSGGVTVGVAEATTNIRLFLSCSSLIWFKVIGCCGARGNEFWWCECWAWCPPPPLPPLLPHPEAVPPKFCIIRIKSSSFNNCCCSEELFDCFGELCPDFLSGHAFHFLTNQYRYHPSRSDAKNRAQIR